MGDSENNALTRIESQRLKVLMRQVESILASSPNGQGYLFRVIESAMYTKGMDLDVICALIKHDPAASRIQEGDDKYLLHHACSANAPIQVVQLLMELNSEALKVTSSIYGEDRVLPLHLACKYSCLETIRLLLSHHPEAAREADFYGYLPLHYASQRENVHAIQVLLYEYPDSIHALTDMGRLPLHCCSQIGRSEQVLQTLMNHYDGGEEHHNGLAVRDEDGRVPLHHAVTRVYNRIIELETLRFLVNSFPEATRFADNDGKLPLHIACTRRGIGHSLEHFRLLLDSDLFSILEVSHDGTSALGYSFDIPNNQRGPVTLEVRQFLLEKQDGALRLMRESFEPAVEQFNLPALVVAKVWSFVLPRLWRPTNDEMNGA